MNYWTELSVEFAATKNYLDELYRVYPISPNLKRNLKQSSIDAITESFNNGENSNLVKQLLKMELFPIKDSYVAFLRRDKSSIDRNPNTVDRIAGNLHAL